MKREQKEKKLEQWKRIWRLGFKYCRSRPVKAHDPI